MVVHYTELPPGESMKLESKLDVMYITRRVQIFVACWDMTINGASWELISLEWRVDENISAIAFCM